MTDSVAMFPPGYRFNDTDGNPLAGGTIEAYVAGTSTPKTIYSDSALSVALGTTLYLDSGGCIVDSQGGTTKVVPYTGTAAYKLVCKNSTGSTQWTLDNIKGAPVIPTTSTEALPQTPVVAKSTTYTVTTADRAKLINANPTGGAFAITLPSAVTAGDNFRIGVRHVGSANTVTVVTQGSETISRPNKATATFVLRGYGETIWLVSDGANWSVDTYAPAFLTGGLSTLIVADRLTATPSSPTAGARYIISGSPTGTWATLGYSADDLVEYDGNGSWIKYPPFDGMFAYVQNGTTLYQYRTSAWVPLSNVTAPTVSYLGRAIFRDEKAQNTSGGTATGTAWTKSDINTTVTNSITGVSIASNVITFTGLTGKYLILASKSFYATNESQIRLRDTTNSVNIGVSPQIYAANFTSGTGPASILSGATAVAVGVLELSGATTNVELQYYVSTGGAGSSLGRVRNVAGENEVYAQIEIIDLSAVQGPTGAVGPQGVDGLDAAYPYQWSTSTSGDPGAGKIAGNNATIASITQIAISETDGYGGTMAGVLASFDDSTSSIKARIKISKEGATQNFHVFSITGTGTDQGAYWTFPVSYISTSGTISNSDSCAVVVLEKGDKGDAGATGSAGSTGATGATGATGPNTGLDYAFNTALSGDPGSGKILLNNATLASVTQVNISKTGRNAESLGTLIGTFDDSTNTTHRGRLRLFAVSDRTKFADLSYTGAFTDNSTYWSIPISSVDATGTIPANNDVLAVMFERTGNKGADGVGTGDVSASVNFTADNRLLRSDRPTTDNKNVQQSGITVDDSNNVSGIGTLGSGAQTVTASTSAALAVGANGATNPALQVDASTVSVATGIKITGAAAGARVAFAAISSGTDDGLSIDAKGAGTIRLGATSTGAVEFSRNAVPTASAGAALGTTTLMWANLFLASGGVINFNNGNATLTHSTGLLTSNVPFSVGTSNAVTAGTVELGHASDTTVSRDSAGVIAVEGVPLYSQIPQNSQSAAYTLVLADAQKHIYHPGSDNNARTFTIPANSSVAYPIGTCLTFINAINTVTIAITTDTLTLAGAGTTGSRTLAANGMATAIKVSSTSWFISGTGLT